MPETTTINYWKPSISENDVEHMKGLGLLGACISGNPYRRHLKRRGEERSLCGAAPGKRGGSYKMRARAGWYLYEAFEAPGCPACEKCLSAAESIERPAP